MWIFSLLPVFSYFTMVINDTCGTSCTRIMVSCFHAVLVVKTVKKTEHFICNGTIPGRDILSLRIKPKNGRRGSVLQTSRREGGNGFSVEIVSKQINGSRMLALQAALAGLPLGTQGRSQGLP